MYKIDRRGGGSKNRSLGIYPYPCVTYLCNIPCTKLIGGGGVKKSFFRKLPKLVYIYYYTNLFIVHTNNKSKLFIYIYQKHVHSDFLFLINV